MKKIYLYILIALFANSIITNAQEVGKTSESAPQKSIKNSSTEKSVNEADKSSTKPNETVPSKAAEATSAETTQQTAPSKTEEAAPVDAAPVSQTQTSPAVSKGNESSDGESTSVTIKDDSSQKQLQLDPLKNGVKLPPIEVEYNLESDSKRLMLNGFALGENSFELSIEKFKSLDSNLAKILGLEDRNILLISYASALIRHGKIEAIGKSGEILWNFEVNADDLANWQEKLKEFKLLVKKDEDKINFNSPFWRSKFGVLDFNLDSDADKLKGKSFRFCITDSDEKYFSRICSVGYSLKNANGNSWILTKEIKTQEPRVLVKNEKAKLLDTVSVTADKPFQFYAGLANGMIIEFFAIPKTVQLVNFWLEPKSKNITFMGHTTTPIKNYNEILPYDPNTFLSKVGWLPTIGDIKKYWTVEVDPTSDSSIVYRGQGGGIFKQRLEIAKVPPDFKVTLKNNTITATYSDSPIIQGNVPLKSVVKSTENKADVKGKKGDFNWAIKANQMSQDQVRSLLVKVDNNEWNYNYSIFRAPAKEFSLRLTGSVAAQTQSVAMGEVAYNQWFESFFGSNNYYYGKQRWGTSLKYFQSLSKATTTDNSDMSLKLLTLDLKYRLTPGVWTLDESWGLTMGYEDLTFSSMKSPLLGGGLFWARSMPKIFDNVFNIVPFMRYPKWVDMDFMYYPVGLKSDVAVGQNYSINFHGKILWTKTIFGEAGFGMKSFDLKDKLIGKRAALQSFYGTVGLGVNF